MPARRLRILPVLLLAAVAGTVAACADDGGPPDLTPDGGNANGSVEITFSPARIIYAPGARVTPQATVRDADGQVVEGAAVTWMASPGIYASDNGDGSYTLSGEGIVTFTACAVLEGGQVCGSRDLRVDASPPQLVISSPLPGEEIDGTANPTVTVEGMLTDTNPDASLLVFVNGQLADLAADGSFSVELTPELGINHVVVEAVDDVGDLAETQLDFLWAPTYIAPDSGTTRFTIADAIVLRIGQRFFDGRQMGTLLDLTTDPVVAQDLAGIVELVLWHADLQALLGTGPVIDDGTLLLNIESVTFDDVIVDAVVTDTGLELFIDLLGVTIQTSGSATLDLGGGPETFSLNGTITADLFASAGLTISQAMDGTVDVSVSAVDASLAGLTASMEDPNVNALIEVGGEALHEPINTLITDQLIPTFTDTLPALFSDLLLEIEAALSDLTFALNEPSLGIDVTINLNADISRIKTMAGLSTGYLEAALNATVEAVGPTGTPIHPESLGAAQASADPVPPFSSFGRLQLAIKQDLINALLHSLWNAGVLDLDVELGGISATVSAGLPPVIVDAPVTSDYDVILQIGQLEVETIGQKFGISAQAGASISVTNNEVSLQIQQTPTIQVWELSDSSGLLTTEVVRDLVLNTVWPMLFESLGSQLSFPLPLPNLGDLGLGDIAPALSTSSLDLVMSQPLDAESGFLALQVDLSLEAPQP